jgi:hypothetical protein
MDMNIGSTPAAADDAEPIMDINTTPLSHSLSHEGRGKEMERMAWA